MTDDLIRRGLSRRGLLQTTAGLIGGSMLPAMPAFAEDKPAIGTYPAGSSGSIGLHRHFGAAHRHLCRAGRRRTQGLPARDRAHQRRQRADQEDLAQDQQGRARQGIEVRRRRFRRQAERGRAGAAALHHREQGGHDHRRHVERGRGRAQQAGAARKGAVRVRHLRLERHHRQGLRALRLPPEFLRPDRGGGDRPGSCQGIRQEQEGGVHDARLHLRSHRHQVDAGLYRDRRLDHRDQPGRRRSARPTSRPICSTSPTPAPTCSSTSTGATTRCCRSSRPSNSACSTR